MAYQDVILADSPWIYYRFNETSGDPANSGSLGGFAVKGGAATQGVAGIPNGDKGISFDGTTNSYVSQSINTDDYRSGAFSVEMWVKIPSKMEQTLMYHLNSGWWVSTDSGGYPFVGGGGLTGDTSGGFSIVDNQWHHIVCTTNTGSTKVYVDGVLRRTINAKITPTSGVTQPLFVSDPSDAAGKYTLNGSVDEFAFYRVELSPAQVSAHYNAGLSTSVSVDVSRADNVSLSSYDITIPNTYVSTDTANLSLAAYSTGLDVTPEHASAGIYASDAEVSATLEDITHPTADYRVHIPSGTRYQTDESTISPTGNPYYGAVFEVDTPLGATIANTYSVKFSFHVDSMAGGTPGWVAYPIVAPPVDNSPIQTGPGVNFNIELEWNTVDLTSVIDVSNFHGVMLAPQELGAAAPAISSIEGSSPAMLITLWEPKNEGVGVDTDLTTLSINAYEADVYVDVEVEVEVGALSMASYEATAEAIIEPDAVVDVDPTSINLSALEAVIDTGTAVDAERGVLSTKSYDADVELTTGADVEVSRADAVFMEAKRPESVNDIPVVPSEGEDPYFVTTWNHLSQSMGSSAWFRMNEKPGEQPVDRTGTWNNSTYENVELGLVGGPDGRTFARFNGDSVFYQNDDVDFGDEFYDRTGTLEFTIRTTKKNQFVLRMDDAMRGTTGAITDTLSRDIYLEDGKINMRSWDFVTGLPNARQVVQFTGFTDIADGNWHHIVLASSLDPRDGSTGYGRVNVYIDGKLEIRRSATGISFPDFIGMRPVYEWEEYGPEEDWFEGDLTEVVFYNGLFLTQDGVFRQYDGVNGFRPLRPARARATAKAHDATVESNTKLVLTINFGATYQGRTPTLTLQDPNSDRYWSNAGPVDVDFNFSGFAYGAGPNNSKVLGGHQFFEVGIHNVKDNVTDEYRLLDLTKDDIDIERYDAINVINFPQSADDWRAYEFYDTTGINFLGLNGRQQVEQLARQIRDLSRLDGKGLFITDPAFAAAVGIIDRYEFVPHLREPRRAGVNRGNSRGTYDYRAATINPWGGKMYEPVGGWRPRPNGSLEPGVNYREMANYYHDDHSNTKQRVVRLVPGLTDIPGHILTDSISYDPYRDEGKQWAEKYEDRPDGLNIGDEFWIVGTQGAGRGGDWDLDYTGGLLSPWMRGRGFVAAHRNNIIAGSAVTTFARNIWVGEQEVPNPYSDYALSIVVEKGDMWNGIPSRGKVYVNFTEGYADMAHTPMSGVRDVIPENEPTETPESLEWDWSSYRGSWRGTSNAGTGSGPVVIRNPDGTTLITPGDNGDTMVGLTYTSRYPQETFSAPQMHYRGLEWILSDVDDSTEQVGVEAARATISSKTATAEAHAESEVYVGTARLNIEAGRMEDVEYADTSVNVQVAGMTIRTQPFAEIVEPGVAKLSIRSGQDIEGDWQEAELVVLKINDSQIIMRMEDDF